MFLPTTQLESHPVGTTGLNAIINANWETLEAIFAPLITGGPDATILWDESAKQFRARPAQDSVVFGDPVDFAGPIVQTIDMAGNLTLASQNRQPGRRATIILTADGSARNLTFPGWRFIGGAAPTAIAANKKGILELISTSGSEAGVLARWSVEP